MKWVALSWLLRLTTGVGDASHAEYPSAAVEVHAGIPGLDDPDYLAAAFHVHPASAAQVSYSGFVDEVKAGHLDEVRITETKLVGTYKKDCSKLSSPPTIGRKSPPIAFRAMDSGPLVQVLEAQHVNFSGTIPSGNIWTGVLISWGPMLLLFVIYFMAMRRMQKGGGAAQLRPQPREDPRRIGDVWIPSSAMWLVWKRPRESCGRLSIS